MTDPASVRTLFMGSAAFAVPSLQALVKAGYQVVAVVSQPPRPAGRHRQLTPPPAMAAAEMMGLPVLHPERLRAPESVDELRRLKPDLIVVVAYGQILPPSVLDLPPRGCLNVHGSLLPRWRGAAPIQASLLAGDEFTGVSLMEIEPTMDTGPVLAQTLTRIDESDDTPALEARLSRGGAALLTSVLPFYLSRAVPAVAQESSQATYASLIKKEDGLIDWTLPAREIWRRNRAYRPWPGTYSYWLGRMLKVVSCRPDEALPSVGEPGRVVPTGSGKDVGVVTGAGVLVVTELALEGGKALGVREFLAGHRDFVGSKLG